MKGKFMQPYRYLMELGFEVKRDGNDVLIRNSDDLEWTSAVVWTRSAPETIATMLAELWERATADASALATIHALSVTIPNCGDITNTARRALRRIELIK
jgi:hypothetical protein